MDRCASYPEDFDELDRRYVDAVKAIPDGSFVQGLMSVVSYVTPEGLNSWRFVHCIELPVSQAIGLLHMATVEMMAQTPHAITNLSPTEDD